MTISADNRARMGQKMTNAEAIETLRANYPDAHYEQLREAVDAAIEALKARDEAGDIIRRQDAIDVLAAMQGQCTTKAALIQNSKIWQQIKYLPSAPVREVQRGRWILNKAAANIDTYYFRCSECGNERCFIGAYKANWCEECGADMREASCELN